MSDSQTIVAYRKLARAFKRNTGTRLTAENVTALYYGDHAIQTVIRDILDEPTTALQGMARPRRPTGVPSDPGSSAHA